MRGCVFCVLPPEVIGETPGFWAKLNLFPVSPGHALIIPRRHVVSLFDLTPDATSEAFALAAVVRDAIGRQLHPDGWNIGINDGRAAGRTIDHLHIHLIPRYLGDVEDPRGGVLNMLPGPSPGPVEHERGFRRVSPPAPGGGRNRPTRVLATLASWRQTSGRSRNADLPSGCQFRCDRRCAVVWLRATNEGYQPNGSRRRLDVGYAAIATTV